MVDISADTLSSWGLPQDKVSALVSGQITPQSLNFNVNGAGAGAGSGSGFGNWFGNLFGGGSNGSSGGGASPGSNLGASTGLGWNVGTGQLLLGGLGALGNIWTAWNANNLANKEFNFTKETANANLANQIQSYNTNLADKANARYVAENNPGGAAAYIAANSLKPVTLR